MTRSISAFDKSPAFVFVIATTSPRKKRVLVKEVPQYFKSVISVPTALESFPSAVLYR